MPRRVDLDQPNLVDHGESLLPTPRFGEGEMDLSDLSDVNQDALASGSCFWAQFAVEGARLTREEADEAHAWLSANHTGPWEWTETWENHGHFLATRVYVERFPDREAFAAAFPGRFSRKGWADEEVLPVAMLRGAMAPKGEAESLSVWSSKRRGYAVSDDGPGALRFVPVTGFAKSAFLAEYGDAFPSDVRDGVEGYLVPSRRGDDRRLWSGPVLHWAQEHCGIGCFAGGPGKDGGYEWRVAVPDPEVREAFVRDWGEGFSWDEASGHFVGPDYPTAPDRDVPEGFLAYLRGEREDYDAPFAPAAAPAP